MANTIIRIFCAFVVVALLHGNAQAIKLDIEPNIINEGLPQEVNITCTVKEQENVTSDVIILEVLKADDEDEKVVAVLKPETSISYGPKMSKQVSAEGRIYKDVKNTYLTVTLKNPTQEMGGEYICKMFYISNDGSFESEKTLANLTVYNQNNTVLIKYLLRELTTIKESLNGDHSTTDQQKPRNESMSAFSVTINEVPFLGESDTITFDDVITNVGNDYDNSTGIFTATQDGVYGFDLALAVKYGYVCNFELIANEKAVASFQVANGYYNGQSSVSSIVHLKNGDKVCARLRSIKTRYSGKEGKHQFLAKDDNNPVSNIFNGYLIKSM